MPTPILSRSIPEISSTPSRGANTTQISLHLGRLVRNTLYLCSGIQSFLCLPFLLRFFVVHIFWLDILFSFLLMLGTVVFIFILVETRWTNILLQLRHKIGLFDATLVTNVANNRWGLRDVLLREYSVVFFDPFRDLPLALETLVKGDSFALADSDNGRAIVGGQLGTSLEDENALLGCVVVGERLFVFGIPLGPFLHSLLFVLICDFFSWNDSNELVHRNCDDGFRDTK